MEKQFISASSLSPSNYESLTEYFLTHNHSKLLSFSIKAKRTKLIQDTLYQVLVAESIFQSLFEESTFQSQSTNKSPIICPSSFQKAITQCEKISLIIEKCQDTPIFLNILFLSIYAKCLVCDGKFDDAIKNCFIPLSILHPSYLTSLIPLSPSFDFITIFRLQAIWAFSIAQKSSLDALPPFRIICDFIKLRGNIDGGAFKDFTSQTLLNSPSLSSFLRHSLLRQSLLIGELVKENRIKPILSIDPLSLMVEGSRSLRIYLSRNDESIMLEDFQLATETFLTFLEASIKRSNYHTSLDPEIIGIQQQQQQNESSKKMLQPHSLQEDILWTIQRLLPDNMDASRILSKIGLDEERWRREHSVNLTKILPNTIISYYKKLLLVSYASQQWIEVIKIGSIIKLAPNTLHFNILLLTRICFKSLDVGSISLLKDDSIINDPITLSLKALLFIVDNNSSPPPPPPIIAKLFSLKKGEGEGEDPYNLLNSKSHIPLLNLLIDLQHGGEVDESLKMIDEFCRQSIGDEDNNIILRIIEALLNSRLGKYDESIRIIGRLIATYTLPNGSVFEEEEGEGEGMGMGMGDGDGDGNVYINGGLYNNSNFNSSSSLQNLTNNNNPHFPYGINPDAPTVYSLTTIKSSLSSNETLSSIQVVGNGGHNVIDSESLICSVKSPVAEVEKIDPYSFDQVISELLNISGVTPVKGLCTDKSIGSNRFRSRFYPPTSVEDQPSTTIGGMDKIRSPSERYSLTFGDLEDEFPLPSSLIMARRIFNTSSSNRKSSLQLLGCYDEIGIKSGDLLALAERLSLLKVETGSILLGILLWSQLALYYLLNGDIDEAVLCQQEAYLMSEIHPLVHTVKGCIKESLCDWKMALESHQRALGLAGDDESDVPRSLMGCARSLMEISKVLVEEDTEERKEMLMSALSLIGRAISSFKRDEISLFGRLAIISYCGGEREALSIRDLIFNELIGIGVCIDDIYGCYDDNDNNHTIIPPFIPFSKKEIARWIPVLGGIF